MTDTGWNFDNTYLRLNDLFYKRIAPTPVASPSLPVFNDALATELGLNAGELNSART